MYKSWFLTRVSLRSLPLASIGGIVDQSEVVKSGGLI
jgi:hypothetical protein